MQGWRNGLILWADKHQNVGTVDVLCTEAMNEPAILMSSKAFLALVYQYLQIHSSGPGPTLIFLKLFLLHYVTFPLGFWDFCHFTLNQFCLFGFSSEWGHLEGTPFKQYGVFPLTMTTMMTTMTMKNYWFVIGSDTEESLAVIHTM